MLAHMVITQVCASHTSRWGRMWPRIHTFPANEGIHIQSGATKGGLHWFKKKNGIRLGRKSEFG